MRTREAELQSHYDNLDYYSPLDHLSFRDIAAAVDCPVVSPILDVGCGDGRLAKRNPDLDVVGIDYNEHRARAAGALCVDLYEYLETAEPFGLVAFIEVLEHLEDPKIAVRLARELGPVLATVPINMPYKAHLQVWPSLAKVQAVFHPTRIAQLTRHAVLYWSPS